MQKIIRQATAQAILGFICCFLKNSNSIYPRLPNLYKKLFLYKTCRAKRLFALHIDFCIVFTAKAIVCQPFGLYLIMVKISTHNSMTLPIKGGKVPSPLVVEGLGEGYFRVNIRTVTAIGFKAL